MKVLYQTLLLAAVATATPETLYSPTPYGQVLSHCVHEVPSGSHIKELPSGDTLVVPPNKGVKGYVIPKCDDRNGTLPVLKRSVRKSVQGLPPNYDGWLQYTALNTSQVGLTGGFDAFTNVMTVPDVPKDTPQVLYFFPGLQNINWIPKVDPEPTPSNPFDIIQPVLQFPGGFLNQGWGLKSWYVTVNAGALFSKEIKVKAGDEKLCNMTRLGETKWSVAGTLKSSGQSTTQVADNERLRLQPWAYNTLECYGCSGCSTFPQTPIVFKENKLYQNGELITKIKGTDWQINPQPAEHLECHERTSVDPTTGDTTISFQN